MNEERRSSRINIAGSITAVTVARLDAAGKVLVIVCEVTTMTHPHDFSIRGQRPAIQ